MDTTDLFDLSHTKADAFLRRFTYPWEALAVLGEEICRIAADLGDAYRQILPRVWVHESAMISPSAYLGAPCIIGARTEVRHGAFVRGGAIVGDGCVIGNSTELKNVILFDGVQVPHFNYVGDSILGFKAHFGAGVITSNVKCDKTPVSVDLGAGKQSTGRKKFGALVGDHVEVGCNSVLNPGVVVGKNTVIYPLSCVRGTIPPHSILKGGALAARRD